MNIPILVMDIAEIILLIASLVFAGYAVKHLHHSKHKKKIMLIKQKVFIFLMIAIALLALGMIVQDALKLLGIYSFPSAADLFFAPSFLFFAVAFGYFWWRIRELHQLHPKEPVFMFGVACGVTIWLYYLFKLSIIPTLNGETPVQAALTFYYPIITSSMFLLTLKIHPTFKAGLIRTPLWYLSHGIFTHFIGYMIYAYSFWNTTHTWFPTAYTALFLISAVYFALGFYAAKKKYR